MFGLLRPRTRLARQAYAICCQVQHRRYGISSVARLSYEATFLYLLAIEAGAAPVPPPSSRTCCRLRVRPLEITPPSPVAAHCAAVGLVLAGAKLDDDVRDDGSLAARAWRWWQRKPIAQATAELALRDPSLEGELASCIAEQLALERAASRSLERCCEPTARAMSRLFGLIPAPPATRDLAREVGREVGWALVALDCARDWWSDARARRFNPLADEAAVAGAREAGRAALRRAADACRAVVGTNAQAARLLDGAANATAAERCTHTVLGRLARWGLVARPGVVLARCDVCCDACVCDCCCGAADTSACCQCGECCSACDCCSACPLPCCDKKPESKASKPAAEDDTAGS